MDSLGGNLRQDDERGRIALITWLYLVVHGRAPDRAGLLAYVQHMREGKTLPQLATEFVAADEFTQRVGRKDAAGELYRHALGAGDGRIPPHCTQADLSALVVSLVLSPDVQARLPILPALYPEGIPLDDSEGYRIWLLEKAAAASVSISPSYHDVVEQKLSLSFVMLLSSPNMRHMETAMKAVLDQTFPDIELLIAARRPFPKMVRQLAARDPRVRLVTAPIWSSTAALFNRALVFCRGQFTARVGQHDRLVETAAAELAAAAATADIVISDDDALDENDLRHSPRLGAAWDPDRVIASGCPGLILGRTALLRERGGMRPTQGLEEWDFLLRTMAGTKTRITHLPSVLVSRRPGPTRHGEHRAHRAAARRYLTAMGHGDCAVLSENGTLHVVYPVPASPPLVSVIIPTRDRAGLLKTCMDGLLQRTSYPKIEVVILDNGSVEPDAVALLQDLARDRRVRVLPRPGPFNWSALNNFGVDQMHGEVAVLLNNDTEVIEPGWLRELVSQAIRPEVGAVGAKLLYPDRTIQHAGVVLGPAGRATHMWRHAPGDAAGYLDQLAITRQVTVVTGACLAVRRDVYQAVGGCDAEGLPITWNDSDLCLRIRSRGLRVIWTPHARLLHLEQATRGSDETEERQERFARERSWMRARWNGALDVDPFLSPSLIRSESEPRPHLAVS